MSQRQMTIEELAAYLELPTETLYKHVRSGRLPARKSGSRWLVDTDEIDRWMDQHATNARDGDVRPLVLVADDDEAVRAVFRGWLELSGCEVREAADGRDVLALVDEHAFDLVFLDLQMPEMNGVAVLREMRQRAPGVDVVIVTGFYSGELMDEVLAVGPAHVLKKPVRREQFMSAARLYLGLPQ